MSFNEKATLTEWKSRRAMTQRDNYYDRRSARIAAVYLRERRRARGVALFNIGFRNNR